MTPEERAAWLVERRKGIGASDAPAVCSVSPWGSPYGVYLDKTGALPPVEMTEPMKWGLLLEDAIAAAYTEKTGIMLWKPPKPIQWHPGLPWMFSSRDRITADEQTVELKNVSVHSAHEWGDAGTDEIPQAYLVQVHHQMEVAEANRPGTGQSVDVAALFGGNDFRVYTVRRSPALAVHMLRIEEEFWLRVQERRAPEPDWTHPGTPGLIAAAQGVDESRTVDLLAPEYADLATAYVDLGNQARDFQKTRDIMKAKILHAMAEASLARLLDGRTITRKEVARKEYTVAATTYVDFRIREPKPTKGKKRDTSSHETDD
jgi:putative phage-type endonuclease